MKFSVIIPAYNSDLYIKKCIDSVLNQTYSNFEIIVIDDGSKDNTYSILKNYKDGRLKVFHFDIKDSVGPSFARNYGISKATGDYIVFVDSDDYIEPNLLEVLNNNIEPDLDLLKYKCQGVNDTGIVRKYHNNIFDKVNKVDSIKNLVQDDLFDSFCLYAFNRKFFIDNDFKCAIGMFHEDFGLIPYIVLKAKKIKSIDYIGYNYYQNDASVTRKHNEEFEIKKADDFIKQYEMLVDKIKLLGSSEENNIILVYITDSVCRKYNSLANNLKKRYKKRIKEVYKNLPSNNIKRFIKKYILMLNVELYLFITKLKRK
ncbi:MAG: glycosyltransferase family A protein [Bacilli bacterium]|nr:glycosyltransferase family A protein [Bacilli bacterium]